MSSPQREDLCLKDQVDSNLNLEILAATRKRWTSSLVVIPNPQKVDRVLEQTGLARVMGKVLMNERPEKSAKVDLPKRARTEATNQAGSSGGRMSTAPVFAGSVNAIQIEDAIYHHADDEWDPAEDFEQGDEGFDEFAGSLEFAEDEFAEDNDADVAGPESVLPGSKEAELWFDPGPGGSEPALDCEVLERLDRIADEVELERLVKMGVLVEDNGLPSEDGSVPSQLSTKMVRTWRKKGEKFLRRSRLVAREY